MKLRYAEEFSVIRKEDCMNNKAVFVKEQLQPLLLAALSNVVSCSYRMSKDKREWVSVEMKNNYVYHIEVTADSLIMLAVDVLEYMKSK